MDAQPREDQARTAASDGTSVPPGIDRPLEQSLAPADPPGPKPARQIPLALLLAVMGGMVISTPLSGPIQGTGTAMLFLQATLFAAALVLVISSARAFQFLGAGIGMLGTAIWTLSVFSHISYLDTPVAAFAFVIPLVSWGGCVRTLVTNWPPRRQIPVGALFELDDAAKLSVLAGNSVECSKCRYDLRGSRVAICPECGTSVRLFVSSASPGARISAVVGAILAWAAVITGILGGMESVVSILFAQKQLGRFGGLTSQIFSWPTLIWLGAGIAVGMASLTTLLLLTPWAGRYRLSQARFLSAGLWIAVALLATYSIRTLITLIEMLSDLLG